MTIKKIRKLLKEDDLKDLEKELDLKKEESDEDEDEDEVKKEKEVEEDSDELDLDKEIEKEAKDEDGEEEEKKDEAEVEEASDEDAPPAEDDVAMDEPEESDAEKEFDLNDESDVFLDDEEEAAAKKEEADEVEKKDDEEVEESADEDEDDEEKKEVKECDAKKKGLVGKAMEKEEKEKDEDEEEVEEAKKPSIDVEEHVKALFNGESLSEEFQNKARTIFQAAVKEKVLQYAKNLKSRYNKKLGGAKQSIQERLVTKLDGYMDYVVEEWMSENKVAVEHGLRTELTEEFVTDLRNLFETHNIMIPKGKENLVEALVAKCDKLEKELDSSEKKNISFKKKLNEVKKLEVVREICEGLADTEIEKLKSLASNIEYDDSYRAKLQVIKENYFSTKTKKADSIEKLDDNKKESEKVAAPANSKMQRYINISKQMR